MKAALFAVLMGLPPYYLDGETKDERAARMTVVAGAMDAAASYATCTEDFARDWCRPVWPASEKAELLAAETAIGWHESRFALHVHQGRCGPTECDARKLPDGRIIHMARSPWQIQWSSVTKDHWYIMVGTSEIATFEASYAAARVLGAARARCQRQGDWVTVAVSAYAGLGCSTWPGAVPRVATYRKILTQLQARVEPAEQPTEQAPAVALCR